MMSSTPNFSAVRKGDSREWISSSISCLVLSGSGLDSILRRKAAATPFPDTLEEVIYQPGQYYGRRSRYFASLVPGETEIRAASRLLQGERHMSPAVVFQANFPQGSGTYLHLRDKILGSTYLCLSSHPKLYTA